VLVVFTKGCWLRLGEHFLFRIAEYPKADFLPFCGGTITCVRSFTPMLTWTVLMLDGGDRFRDCGVSLSSSSLRLSGT
jgi:hypothetical protein